MEFIEGKKYLYDGNETIACERQFDHRLVTFNIDPSSVLVYHNGRMYKEDMYFSPDILDVKKFRRYFSDTQKNHMKSLEEQYAGNALQGILTYMNVIDTEDDEIYEKVASAAKMFAAALVEKFAGEM